MSVRHRVFPDRAQLLHSVKKNSLVAQNDELQHLKTNQSDVESVLEVMIPDFECLLCGLQLEDHSVEGQLLSALLWNELHTSSKLHC